MLFRSEGAVTGAGPVLGKEECEQQEESLRRTEEWVGAGWKPHRAGTLAEVQPGCTRGVLGCEEHWFRHSPQKGCSLSKPRGLPRRRGQVASVRWFGATEFLLATVNIPDAFQGSNDSGVPGWEHRTEALVGSEGCCFSLRKSPKPGERAGTVDLKSARQ